LRTAKEIALEKLWNILIALLVSSRTPCFFEMVLDEFGDSAVSSFEFLFSKFEYVE